MTPRRADQPQESVAGAVAIKESIGLRTASPDVCIETDVLDPEPAAFHVPKPGAVHDREHQAAGARELRDQPLDLPAGEHDGQSLRLRRLAHVEKAEVASDDDAIQKQECTLRLILGAGGDVAGDSQIGEKRLDLGLAAPREVGGPAMPHESFDPAHIRPFGLRGLVPQTHFTAGLLDDRRFPWVDDAHEVSLVLRPRSSAAVVHRLFPVCQPVQDEADGLQGRSLAAEHDPLVGLDGPRRLQPLPRGRAVVSQGAEEADHVLLRDRQVARGFVERLGVSADPSRKPLPVRFAQLGCVDLRGEPFDAHVWTPMRVAVAQSIAVAGCALSAVPSSPGAHLPSPHPTVPAALRPTPVPGIIRG